MQLAQNSDMLLPQTRRVPRDDFCLLLQCVGVPDSYEYLVKYAQVGSGAGAGLAVQVVWWLP